MQQYIRLLFNVCNKPLDSKSRPWFALVLALIRQYRYLCDKKNDVAYTVAAGFCCIPHCPLIIYIILLHIHYCCRGTSNRLPLDSHGCSNGCVPVHLHHSFDCFTHAVCIHYHSRWKHSLTARFITFLTALFNITPYTPQVLVLFFIYLYSVNFWWDLI